jgi:hypothetical protein
MLGVKDREYLFGRDIGLAIGVYGGKPAEDAGFGRRFGVQGESRGNYIN